MKLHNWIALSMVIAAPSACGDDAPMSTASTASEASASEASTSEASTSEGSGPGSSTAPPPTTGGTSSDESTDTGAPTSSGAPGFCGDGTVDDGEECDDGPNNGPDGPCNSDCTHGCPTSTPLAVLARTPAGEGVAAPTDAALTLTFTCAIDRDTVTEDTVFVHGSQTGRRKFTVTWDGTTATLEFARPLLPAERIDVTLTSGIRDLMGNALKPQVFHFTVSGAPSSGTYVADSTDIGTWMYGAVGDLDGDGDVDIARADGYVYYNDGTEAFSYKKYWNHCNRVRLADVDGDHDLDLLCTSNLGSAANLYVNDGAGKFTPGFDSKPFYGATDAGFVDFDGDGDLDAWAVTYEYEQADIILLNDGSGNFSIHTTGVGAKRTGDFAFADVDADGDVDALIGETNVDGARLWLNDGLGGFVAGNATFGSISPTDDSFLLADVNGDGAADAVLLTWFEEQGELWLNDAAGMFTGGAKVGVKKVESALACDLDGDGDVDLATANDSLWDGTNQVLLNAGDGTFAAPLPLGPGADSIAAADLNGDGIIDIILDDVLFLGQ